MTIRRAFPRWSSSRLSSAIAWLRDREGLPWAWHLAIFCFCALLVVSRRIVLFDHPAFYAEDGAVWYSDAYNFGWLRSLASPAGGYFNTLPRLIAALTLFGPFSVAPLLMNLAGLTLHVLPVNVLLLKRSAVWGPLPLRTLQAFVYLVIPNVEEVHVVLTNAQFHVALIAFLLLVAYPPRSRLARILDLLVMLLNGFTGPFCFVILPLVTLVWSRRRNRWSQLALVVYACAAVAQGVELSLAAKSGRPSMYLGATVMRFVRIVSGQIYIDGILGRRVGLRFPGWLLILCFLLGTAFLTICLRRCRFELRLFAAFSAILFAASLLRPFIEMPEIPAWLTLSLEGGNRYWFFPLVTYGWCIVWAATQYRWRLLRFVGVALLVLMVRGVVHDWRLPKYKGRNFSESARRLDAATEGSLVVIPIFPASNWQMRLDKKGPKCQFPPASGVDSTTSNLKVERAVLLQGWLAAAEPIRHVEILVDGRVVKQTQLNANRPEVDLRWPFSASKQKGWATNVDISALSPGEHKLSAYAIEEHGCRAEIETFPFTKATTP